jgi:hypothetical protein
VRRLLFVLVLQSMAVGSPAFASDPSRTLVLPLRTLGVSDTTAAVVGNLLQGELESRGVAVVPSSRLGADLTRGDAACDDAECATAAAAKYAAARVVYGSLSRLGGKIIVAVRALRAGESTPYYADQLAANTAEDLDAVVNRIADTISAGRSKADQATIDNVTQAETLEPRRRASRSSAGLRVGFLIPVADSYGGVDRLTSARVAFKYETRNMLIETTPLLGFAWRGSAIEWTMLDVFAARLFGTGDFSTYLGGGLGVHSLRIERSVRQTYGSDSNVYYYYKEQSETTLTADAGLGLFALRTYDFSIFFDLRYHYVFANFDGLGGRGAHGVAITFGTSR